MPVQVKFLNASPTSMTYDNPEAALRDVRTRTLRVQSLTIVEQSLDSYVDNKSVELIAEARPWVEHLTINILDPYGTLRECPLIMLDPGIFPRLEAIALNGCLPFNLSHGFDCLQRLELRASSPLMPCINTHFLVTAMGTWKSLTELRLHHCMRLVTAEPLPWGFAAVALSPRLRTLTIEDSPDAVYRLLTHLDIPSHVQSHFIASCPQLPVDVGPLFQMLTTTPYIEFPEALGKLDLPSMGQVKDIHVDFRDNLTITGSNAQGGHIKLEIRAPPPGPDSMASRPALVSAAIRRLPELFNYDLEPDQQLVQKLEVDADVSMVTVDDWRRLLGRYSLGHLRVTDHAMGSSCDVLEALCPHGNDIASPNLSTLELADFLLDDLAALRDMLKKRVDIGCDLVNLYLRYHWAPSWNVFQSLEEARFCIESEVKEGGPNMDIVQVQILR